MNKLYAIAYPVFWIFFRLIHPWKAVGHIQMPAGGALLCGNHTTISDPIYVLMALGWKNQCRAMAKAELLRIPLLGFILKHVGVIGVDRGKSDVAAIKAAMKALKNGEKLLMFPEGTRVKRGEKGEVHTGAAMLATRTDVPIIPIYIPRKKRWFVRTTVVFGEPYRPTYSGSRPTSEDYESISDEIMNRIYSMEEQAN